MRTEQEIRSKLDIEIKLLRESIKNVDLTNLNKVGSIMIWESKINILEWVLENAE